MKNQRFLGEKYQKLEANRLQKILKEKLSILGALSEKLINR